MVQKLKHGNVRAGKYLIVYTYHNEKLKNEFGCVKYSGNDSFIESTNYDHYPLDEYRKQIKEIGYHVGSLTASKVKQSLQIITRYSPGEKISVLKSFTVQNY